MRPYLHFLRVDRWGYPLVYPVGTFMVMTGADRRETGTHYTPKSLTEVIVKETLEPLVYVGPAEGNAREDWKLRSPAELLDLKICDPAMGSGAFLVQVCRWLSERLVEAWGEAETAGQAITAEGEVVNDIGGFEPLRDDAQDRMLTACRLIAERCLYGVDVNPLAVELAKLSIWLVTLARGRPFGFLDHNLRCGDSLLGIHDLEQLHYLDMKPGKGSAKKLFATKIDEAVEEAIALRSYLRSRPIRDIRDVKVMASLDEQARGTLELSHLIADAFIGEVLAAGGKDIDATAMSIEAGTALSGDDGKTEALRHRARNGLNADLLAGKSSRRPFHWPLEFPEVFSRVTGGFDAMLGNPPFVGGRRIRAALGKSMVNWLKAAWPHGSLNADLCVYFYLTAAMLVRHGGNIGFLGTKTIAQGDTARTGLVFLIEKLGVSIYFARSSFKWPGTASVIAALIIAQKGYWHGQRVLNGKPVVSISPILDDEGTWGDAHILKENKTRSFQGSVLVGKGFVLTEEEAKFFFKKRSENKEVIKPYLSGDDLNSNPDEHASRWAIDFRDRPLDDCERKWPELMARIRELVKPQRDKVARKAHKKYWWHHGDKRPALYQTIKNMVDVFVIARVTKYVAIVKVLSNQVFHDKVYVFTLEGWHSFSVLQSSFHDAWVRRGSSTVGETLNYTPSDYFDTFPFLHLEGEDLYAIGKVYHSHRKSTMLTNLEGLTNTYNRFHSPEDRTPAINTLRELHVTMDTEVAKAYRWDDLELAHDFYETKQGLRFTISEQARRESLSRLIELNHEIYELEESKKERASSRSHLLDDRNGPLFTNPATGRSANQTRIGHEARNRK